MAAVSKAMARSFRDRLEALDCPYTEGVDESWISELIFKPGDARLRLLQWLFSKFDSTLNELLDPRHASAEMKMDSRVQRLLFVASTLGLCKANDADLIRGVTSVPKQVTFMDLLIDLVAIKDAAEDPILGGYMAGDRAFRETSTLDEQFLHDSWYIDALASDSKVSHILATDVGLLPADLVTQLERPSHPDFGKLMKQAEEVAGDLRRQNEMLADLNSVFTYEEPDAKLRSRVLKTLQLVLSELSQLVTSFSFVFENEMKAWCSKTPPCLSELGPSFKRVYTLLTQFNALLTGLASLRSSHKSICIAGKQHRNETKTTDKTSQLVSISRLATDSFRECLSVLEESRQQSSESGRSWK